MQCVISAFRFLAMLGVEVAPTFWRTLQSQFSWVIEVEGICIVRYRSRNRSMSGRVEHGITESGAMITNIGAYHHCVIKEAIETAK
jgi:hypothetical protein